MTLALGYTLQPRAPHKLHFLQDQQVTWVKSLTVSLIVRNCELKWVCLEMSGIVWKCLEFVGLSSFTPIKIAQLGVRLYDIPKAVPEGPASICAEHQVVAWQCLVGWTLR